MLIQFCLHHNAISFKGTWTYPREKVEKLLSIRNKPAFLVDCPKCLEKKERTKNFWRNHGYSDD